MGLIARLKHKLPNRTQSQAITREEHYEVPLFYVERAHPPPRTQNF